MNFINNNNKKNIVTYNNHSTFTDVGKKHFIYKCINNMQSMYYILRTQVRPNIKKNSPSPDVIITTVLILEKDLQHYYTLVWKFLLEVT